jgi:hypothetical protein
MKTKNPTVPRLTGLACLLLLTGSSGAITVATGDLILGFRANGGQGSGINLEVNLGPASQYTNPASPTFTVPGLSTLDLISTYGSNWNTRSDLAWGIVGATTTDAVGLAPARTLWASNAEPSPGTLSTAWTRSSASGQQNASNAIATMYSGPAGALSLQSPTPNSPTASFVDSSLGGSWTVQDDLTAGVSFRRFNPTVTGTLNTIPGTPAVYDGTRGYTVLDVWEMQPGPSGTDGTLVGAFGLAADGNLVFSTNPGVFAPVPEPSATITLLGAAFAVAARRRRPA